MRPTRDPKHKNAWAHFDSWQQNRGAAWENSLAKPNPRYNTKQCFYCNKGWAKGRQRTRQHLLPRRRGGLLVPDNLRWCCYLCNQLLATVDDCPVLLNVYKHMIEESPLRYLPLRTAFPIYIAMRDDNCSYAIQKHINALVRQLDHKKNKYTARKILAYMRKAFPAVIRMRLPKHELPFVFSPPK